MRRASSIVAPLLWMAPVQTFAPTSVAHLGVLLAGWTDRVNMGGELQPRPSPRYATDAVATDYGTWVFHRDDGSLAPNSGLLPART